MTTSKKTTINPEISFAHVLKELSVNRAAPCEVLRELISNAYDANSKNIWYFPLMQYNGFIFIDDGDGMSLTKEINEITPYRAFFSIGRSTKIFGHNVGYKCQGSKLCFASSRFALFTKEKSSTKTPWYFKLIENPAEVLTQNYDLTPLKIKSPYVELNKLLNDGDVNTKNILNILNEKFWTNFTGGTVIIVIGFKADNFNKFFNTTTGKGLEESYIYNYIRYYTKHGDTCRFQDGQGFNITIVNDIKKSSKETTKFHTIFNQKIITIPSGFDYLPLSKETATVPDTLRHGRFQSRHIRRITFASKEYFLILAVDGRRRRLDEYPNLGREKNPASGVRLVDQCGLFISAKGIKSVAYNEIFSMPIMRDFACLGEAEGIIHYTMFIDGPFSLVTNRNSLADDARQVLASEEFLENIRKFLEDSRNNDPILKELIDQLEKKRFDGRRQKQTEKITAMKASIDGRERFRIRLEHDNQHDTLFFSPSPGEEHGVGALYATLASTVASKPSQFSKEILEFWYRPLTFSGIGIDAIAVPCSDKDARNKFMLEYKYKLSSKDEFNHPLCSTDIILAWLIDQVHVEDQFSDSYDTFGTVEKIQGIDLSLAFYISNLQTNAGETFRHKVKVICLKNLIKDTFKITFVKPKNQNK